MAAKQFLKPTGFLCLFSLLLGLLPGCQESSSISQRERQEAVQVLPSVAPSRKSRIELRTVIQVPESSEKLRMKCYIYHHQVRRKYNPACRSSRGYVAVQNGWYVHDGRAIWGYAQHNGWLRAGQRANLTRNAPGQIGPNRTEELGHTFASFALKSGWPIGQLAKWLGHSDINTTYSIYGHLIAEEPPDLKFE